MKNNLKNNKSYKYIESVIDLKNKRTIQITYLSLTIVALIFFGLFAINPTLSTIASLQKQLSDNKFVDEQLQTKINNLTSLQGSYSTLASDIPVINGAVPQTPQAPILLAQIQSVAQKSNITLLSSQVFPVELDNKLSDNIKDGTFTFVILGQGTDSDIYSFIDSLSQMRRVISLDQITISKKANDLSVSQISIRGSAFYKP